MAIDKLVVIKDKLRRFSCVQQVAYVLSQSRVVPGDFLWKLAQQQQQQQQQPFKAIVVVVVVVVLLLWLA